MLAGCKELLDTLNRFRVVLASIYNLKRVCFFFIKNSILFVHIIFGINFLYQNAGEMNDSNREVGCVQSCEKGMVKKILIFVRYQYLQVTP